MTATRRVLNYHRVGDARLDPLGLTTSTENFAAQMRYLKQDFEVVSLDELEIPGPNSVAITFDDAYMELMSNAIPILDALQVPVTIFIITDMLDSPDPFWWEEALALFIEGSAKKSYVRLPVGRVSVPLPFFSKKARAWSLIASIRLLRTLSPPEIRKSIFELREQISCPPRLGSRCLTTAELRALAGSKIVTVASHSLTHSRLSTMSEADQSSELVDSKARLELLINRSVRYFSIPYGDRRSYSHRTIELLKSAGYRRAFTNNVRPRETPFLCARQSIADWTLERFKSFMSPVP